MTGWHMITLTSFFLLLFFCTQLKLHLVFFNLFFLSSDQAHIFPVFFFCWLCPTFTFFTFSIMATSQVIWEANVVCLVHTCQTSFSFFYNKPGHELSLCVASSIIFHVRHFSKKKKKCFLHFQQFLYIKKVVAIKKYVAWVFFWGVCTFIPE